MDRRRRRNRSVRVVAGAFAVLGVAACTPGGCEPPPGPPPDVLALQVLSFNDFHGHLEPPGGTDATLGPRDPAGTPVGGAEYLSAKLTELRAKAAESVTVAAGDLIGGTPFLSGLFHDEPAVESLNAMGLDVSGVGNHEFDEGLTELLRMQDGGCHPEDGCYEAWGGRRYPGASFPWLAANVIHESNGQTVLPGTAIQTIAGVKVGYIGMTLEDTPSLVAQAGIQGIDFLDEVETANTAARNLRAKGVQTIIVLLHEGGVQAGTYNECVGISGPIVAIAENLHAEIDLVVTGHTHQPYNCMIPDPTGQSRMVTSASSFGRVVTETMLYINKGSGQVDRSKTTSVNHLVNRANPDPVQTEIIDRWSATSDPIANEVIGTISADLLRSPNRDTESSLGNVIADAQLAATAAPEDGGALIAFMNPGGVRADLTIGDISGGEASGEVTYGEAFEVQPFGNLLVTMDLTGAQIQQLLEQQAVAARSRPVLIFGVSNGFTFAYDPAAPFGSRVADASVALNGVPLDANTTYRIVTNNFLADGGDGFTVFQQGTNRVGGGDDLVALVDHFAVNRPVGPPADRITGV